MYVKTYFRRFVHSEFRRGFSKIYNNFQRSIQIVNDKIYNIETKSPRSID